MVAFSDLDVIPFVLAVACIAVVALQVLLLKLPWRYRLRTLFIATTLVALLLGAMVYAVRI